MNQEKVLLPGYIFLFTEGELPFDLLPKTNHLYQILQYEKGVRELSGSDAEYAHWIYKYHGQIETSKILVVGKAITVIDGPLLDYQGKIVKLDKHKRRVWVEFIFNEQKTVISLGADCIY